MSGSGEPSEASEEMPPREPDWRRAYSHLSLAMQIALDAGEEDLAAEVRSVRSLVGKRWEEVDKA